MAAFAGLVDADAVTLTASRMAAEGLELRTAAYAVLIAAGVDSVSKTAVAKVAGSVRFGLLFGAGTLLAAAAAAAAFVWLG